MWRHMCKQVYMCISICCCGNMSVNKVSDHLLEASNVKVVVLETMYLHILYAISKNNIFCIEMI